MQEFLGAVDGALEGAISGVRGSSGWLTTGNTLW